MRKSIYLFMVASILLVSCDKDSENMTVLIDQSGYFNVKIVGLDQKGIEGIKVSLYPSGTSGVLAIGETNASGEYDFGKLLQGYYQYAGMVEKNGMDYYFGRPFQIIAGDTKSFTDEPFLNVGDLTVTIVDHYYLPIENINVALIPEYYSYNDPFQSSLDKAYFIRSTNSDGTVFFNDVPAGTGFSYRSYSIMVYFDENSYDYPSSNNLRVSYHSNEEYTFSVDL
ncbi:MAG: MSCRAMM family adhesin SdrC [Bacteroidales bacterium]|nr:MSCRAMM family adhesin SdrC [Bacteroidales bacterium]MCF8454662.1 MSCRAMM family adhesin SdrC [Bacteroidales bacterium]